MKNVSYNTAFSSRSPSGLRVNLAVIVQVACLAHRAKIVISAVLRQVAKMVQLTMTRPRMSPSYIPCAACGNGFPHNPRRPRRTCSQPCKARLMSERRKGIKRRGIGGTKRRSKLSIECAICTQVIAITAQQASDGLRTCSKSCRGELISRSKGSLGTGTCEGCGVVYKVSRYHLRAGRRFCGDICRLAWWATQTPSGEDNPLWTGGHLNYYGPTWQAARRTAWKRDNEACTACGRTREELGQRPIVHHVIPFKSFGVERHEAANHLDNLVCVCRSCHTKAHWKLRGAH